MLGLREEMALKNNELGNAGLWETLSYSEDFLGNIDQHLTI